MTYQEELAVDQARLEELLENMGVTKPRRVFGQWNLLWLREYLPKRSDHKDYTEALALVNKLHREFFE